ncbi:MAG: hypothetical protein DMD41_07425 [Gemmatimonadetes bacterium]|nr:MAG: hypothetical protein DMD41_07425 [Gemmatimonadota bacterium]
MSDTVTITGIAAGGDGVGRLADGRAVFVPRTVPGERVRLRTGEGDGRGAASSLRGRHASRRRARTTGRTGAATASSSTWRTTPSSRPSKPSWATRSGASASSTWRTPRSLRPWRNGDIGRK